MHRLGCLAAVAACACSSTAKPAGSTERWDALAQRVLEHLFHNSPTSAVFLGLHDYDGEMPDVTPAGIDARITAFRADEAALVARAPATPLEREERDALLVNVRGTLFDLVDRDRLHHNPMAYTLDLEPYIVRDYAPAAVRAAAVAQICKAGPAYFAQAEKNLQPPFPKPWLDTALLQTKGTAEFAHKDARTALPEAAAALDGCETALNGFTAWLEQQLPAATEDYALGEKRFLAMLAATEGITLDLATLKRIAETDLERNLKALAEAAHAIDPTKSVAEVVATVQADRPAPTNVLAVATEQAAQLRQFVLDHKIVTIPPGGVAEVRETLPFARWNAASLSAPGNFDANTLQSYYYITPPDPSWPVAEQTAYLMPKANLLFTTVHEVYPGHYIDYLHARENQSRVLRSLGSYVVSEGWAHYTEEMMYEAGIGDHKPAAHVGQLTEALLRDVRFVVAIGEHTGGMTVAQAEALFRDKAFLSPADARQQAVRGTFDPMYLAYTIGKLGIMKLRDDWRARNPTAQLGDFHDALLSHSGAPLPVIRRAMLGDDSPVF